MVPSRGILGIWSGGDDVDDGVSAGEGGGEGEDVDSFVAESSGDCSN